MAEVVKVTLEVCYPNGALKSVTWAGDWVKETAALLLCEDAMNEEQLGRFHPKRSRLRFSKWKSLPTLIRQLREGVGEANQAVCSITEFADAVQGGNPAKRRKGRGTVHRATLYIDCAGYPRVAIIEGELIQETAALVFDPDAMCERERQEFNRDEGAAAVRRLVASSGDDKHFKLIYGEPRPGEIGDRARSRSTCGLKLASNVNA